MSAEYLPIVDETINKIMKDMIYVKGQWYSYNYKTFLYERISTDDILDIIKGKCGKEQIMHCTSKIYLGIYENRVNREKNYINDITQTLPLRDGFVIDRSSREQSFQVPQNYYTFCLNVKPIIAVDMEIRNNLMNYFRDLTYGNEELLIKCCAAVFFKGVTKSLKAVVMKTSSPYKLFLQILMEQILGNYCYDFTKKLLVNNPMLLVSTTVKQTIPYEINCDQCSYWAFTNEHINETPLITQLVINDDIEAQYDAKLKITTDVLDVAFSLFTFSN